MIGTDDMVILRHHVTVTSIPKFIITDTAEDPVPVTGIIPANYYYSGTIRLDPKGLTIITLVAVNMRFCCQ